jgi:hypothetical protein
MKQSHRQFLLRSYLEEEGRKKKNKKKKDSEALEEKI